MQERTMTDPAFGSELRDQLRLGKYTRQFADMTGDEIMGLLWLLGEYTVRAEPIKVRDPVPYPGDRRRITAHNGLLHGPYSLERTRRLIRDVMVG